MLITLTREIQEERFMEQHHPSIIGSNEILLSKILKVVINLDVVPFF